MSMGDILDTEIERRRAVSADLIAAQADIEATIEQFNKLDEVHRTNEKAVRVRLEGVYKEARHFTGSQPKVYSSAETEKYPFYAGQTDDLCNPYFPILKVQAKVFDGISPLEALPTRTGAWARAVSFSPVESTLRNPALAGVAAFPDISGETGTGTCIGAIGPNEATCITNGGTWQPPSYAPGATATEKLKSVLDAWRPQVVNIISDLYNNTGSTELSYWQNILAKIDAILPAIQVHVVYPNHTLDFVPGSAPDLARDYLIANTASINTHVSNRVTFLNKEATSEEQLFFGVIKLRLHQANGSFAKLQAAKSQKSTNKSIVEDNEAGIRSLNLLKVKSS
jgi:hypothetical protein